MLQMAFGHSEDVDSPDAIEAALDQATRRLDGAHPLAAVLLAGVDYDHETVLERIEARYPGLPLVGCTTDGEFSSELGYREDSVNLILLAGQGLEIRTGLGRDISLDTVAATRQAVQEAMDGTSLPPALCLTFPDGVSTSVSSVVDGLKGALADPRLPIVGGASGDHRTFDRTRQFYDGLVLCDAVPILVVCGEVHISCGVASGWQPVGDALVVTHSEGNRVFRLDDRRALDVYRDLLGTAADGTSFADFPLAVYEDPEDATAFVLRAPFFEDESDGSLTFAGDVTQGCRAHIAQAIRGGALEGTRESIRAAARDYPGQRPDSAFLISCAARKVLMGGTVSHEATVVQELLEETFGAAIPLCGFYAFGEIAPAGRGQQTRFHNESLVTLLLGSR